MSELRITKFTTVQQCSHAVTRCTDVQLYMCSDQMYNCTCALTRCTIAILHLGCDDHTGGGTVKTEISQFVRFSYEK